MTVLLEKTLHLLPGVVWSTLNVDFGLLKINLVHLHKMEKNTGMFSCKTLISLRLKKSYAPWKAWAWVNNEVIFCI